MMRAVKGHDFNDVNCLCVFEVFCDMYFFQLEISSFLFCMVQQLYHWFSFFFFFEDLSSHDE